MTDQKLSTWWDGYCPESYLKGKKVRMRLNSWDFFESEETGLQMAVHRGVLAIILNFRGKGDFRFTKNYADEVVNGELLTTQTSDNFPFYNKQAKWQKDGVEIEEFINNLQK